MSCWTSGTSWRLTTITGHWLELTCLDQNGVRCTLHLRSDRTFVEELNRTGDGTNWQTDTWRRYGESPSFVLQGISWCCGEEQNASGEAHGQFGKSFGLITALALARPGRTNVAKEPLRSLSHHLANLAAFLVGRISTSLTKDCGACFTSISTTLATSSGFTFQLSSLKPSPRPPKPVFTDPGATTDTRMLYCRSSSATEYVSPFSPHLDAE